MSKEAGIRGKVISEILSTEVTYVRLLGELSDKLASRGIVSTPDAGDAAAVEAVQQVALGIRSILSLQQQFLGDLRKRLCGGNTSSTSSPTASSRPSATERNPADLPAKISGDAKNVEVVCGLFEFYAKVFELYVTYITNYFAAMDYFQSQADKTKYADLASKLILPIQRVPRYVLLLKELLKRSNEGVSEALRARLRRCIASVETVATHLNGGIKTRQELMRMNALQRVIHVDPEQPILVPARKLVRAQDLRLLRVGTEPHQQGRGLEAKLLLFNDVLMVAPKCPTINAYVGVSVFAARSVAPMDKSGTSDPYVKVFLPVRDRLELIGKTDIVYKTLNPMWRGPASAPKLDSTYFEFQFSGLPRHLPKVEFRVYDDNAFKGDQYMGEVSVDLGSMVQISNNNPRKVYTADIVQWRKIVPGKECREATLLRKMLEKQRRAGPVKLFSSKSRQNPRLGDLKVQVEVVYIPSFDAPFPPQRLTKIARKALKQSAMLPGGGQVKRIYTLTDAKEVEYHILEALDHRSNYFMHISGDREPKAPEEKTDEDGNLPAEMELRVGIESDIGNCVTPRRRGSRGESKILTMLGLSRSPKSMPTAPPKERPGFKVCNQEIGYSEGRLAHYKSPSLHRCTFGGLATREAREWASAVEEIKQVKAECDLLNAVQKASISEVETLLHFKQTNPNTPRALNLKKSACAPLAMAASMGRTDVCQMLLEHGASVNEVDAQGQTVLMSAASKNNREIIKLLLRYRADPTIKNMVGRTASDMASPKNKKYFPTWSGDSHGSTVQGVRETRNSSTSSPPPAGSPYDRRQSTISPTASIPEEDFALAAGALGRSSPASS